MRRLPDPLLHPVEQPREHEQEDHDSEANSPAFKQVRLGRPAEKGGDVPGVVVQGRRRAILVIDHAVCDRLRHRDLVSGEVQIPLRVVGLRITGQDRMDVVGAHLLIFKARQRVKDEPRKAALILSRFRQQRHVRRRLAERRGGGLIVRIGLGARDDVGRRAGALEDLALVVGRGVGDLIRGGKRLDLILGEARPARLGERAERNAQSVTGAADLLVHLEPALKLRRVVDAEHAPEAPAQTRRVRLVSIALRERRQSAREGERHRGRESESGKPDTDHR